MFRCVNFSIPEGPGAVAGCPHPEVHQLELLNYTTVSLPLTSKPQSWTQQQNNVKN